MSTDNSIPSKARTMSSGTSSNDTIKRLIVSASILVKQLDSIVAKAKGCKDLFTPEAIELRSQLSYLCAKSISADPLQCRRRAEELLWKKCFYEVISSAKLSCKKSPLTSVDKFYLGSHIDLGISKFTEHLRDVCSRLEKMDSSTKHQILNIFPVLSLVPNQTETKESREELLESTQRILVWLGDLSRYRCDLGISNRGLTAQRFYQQAILVNPSSGLPFNQLGTLASHDSSRSFESMFYYMRSLKASKAFPGAGPNLKTLLSRLATSDDKLTASFSRLLSSMALESKQENAFEIGQLCQVTLAEIQQQLGDENCNHSRLLELASAAMLCASTREANTSQSTAAIAFCCSLFSHVLAQFAQWFGLDVEQHEQEGRTAVKAREAKTNASDGEEEDEEEETKRARMRRRKIVSNSSDQEFSEEELSIDSDVDDSEGTSDEEEELSDSGFHSAEAKTEPPPLELPPPSAALLPLFKAMTDWFRANPQVIRVSSQSVRKMWADLAKVLNALRRCRREDIQPYRRSPLPEDWKSYGLLGLSGVHAEMDFDDSAPTPEPGSPPCSSIRIERILSFGMWLAEETSDVSGFKYDGGVFSCPLDEWVSSDAKAEEKKTDLMRNMAHLWLKSEVQELERKLSPKPTRRKTNKKNSTSWELSQLPFVFVVPDVSALTGSTQLIKQIVKSQKLIVVIPDVVVSEMDLLKKESSSVRDCIKWLESCFKNGNRFIRAQRADEHQSIPLLTYPKRKDKANWTFFQIMECCHYLDRNQRQAYKNGQNAPIVLFLTGTPSAEVEQQTKGVCSSIGVELKTTESLLRKEKTKKT